MYEDYYNLEDLYQQYLRLLSKKGLNKRKMYSLIDVLMDASRIDSNLDWSFLNDDKLIIMDYDQVPMKSPGINSKLCLFLDWYFLNDDKLIIMDYDQIPEFDFIRINGKQRINDDDIIFLIEKHCYRIIYLLFKEKINNSITVEISLSSIIKKLTKEDIQLLKKHMENFINNKIKYNENHFIIKNNNYEVFLYNKEKFSTPYTELDCCPINYIQNKSIYVIMFSNKDFAFFWFEENVIYVIDKNGNKDFFSFTDKNGNDKDEFNKISENIIEISENIIFKINNFYFEQELLILKRDKSYENTNRIIKKEKINYDIITDCIFCNNGTSLNSHYISRSCLSQHGNNIHQNNSTLFWSKKNTFEETSQQILQNNNLFSYSSSRNITFRGFCQIHEMFFNDKMNNIDDVNRIKIDNISCDKMFFRNIGIMYNDFIYNIYYCILKKYCLTCHYEESILSKSDLEKEYKKDILLYKEYQTFEELHKSFIKIIDFFDSNKKYNMFHYKNMLSEYLYDINLCKKLYHIFPLNNSHNNISHNNMKLMKMKHCIFETNKKLPFSCTGFHLLQYDFYNKLLYLYNKNLFNYMDKKDLLKCANIKEVPIRTKQKFINFEDNLDINNVISISIQIVKDDKSIIMFSYYEEFVNNAVVEDFLKSFRNIDNQISKLFIFCSIFFENLLIEKTFLEEICKNEQDILILQDLFMLDVKTPSKSKKINFCIYNKASDMFNKYFKDFTIKEINLDENP